MFAKLPRKILLIGILSAVVLTLVVASAVPAMAATPGTTTTTTTTTVTPPVNSAKPTVTGVSPAQAAQGEKLSVTISGTNFTGATAVFLGRNITVSDFKVTNATTITANIVVGDHAGVGSRVVRVTTPSGKGAMKAAFTVTSDRPTVTGVTPGQGKQGEKLSVTITGTNFTGATAVSFGRNITVSDFKVTSATTITANIVVGDHAAVGSRIVRVTNTSGKGAMKAGFTVTKGDKDTTPTTTPTTTKTTK
jgi:hypothetical protein